MNQYDQALQHVNTHSRPSELKITDIRFVDLADAPMHCTLLKIYTNQGIVGLGEVRDYGSRTYAALLKSRLLGENPCDVDRLFRRIKQFGGTARQGGGVSGIEIALWDLAGKAYGVPVFQMLGGKFRDSIPVYMDKGFATQEEVNTGAGQARALKERARRFGCGMVKAVVGIEFIQSLHPEEILVVGPPGYYDNRMRQQGIQMDYMNHYRLGEKDGRMDYARRNRAYDAINVQHFMTGLRITEKGLDRYEEYVADLRHELGNDIMLAIDHLGYMGLEDATKLLRRLEKYHLTWAEDVLPMQYVQEYTRLSQSTTTPLATGEDIYLTENIEELCKNRGVAFIHPDICSSGGILETKKMGDMAQRYHVSMALHMCETPVAALATAHMGVATENFFSMEFNAPDVAWWDDMVTGTGGNLIRNGQITPSEKPGLGIDDFNDEVLKDHLFPGFPALWAPTDEWNFEYSNDRAWS